MKKQICLLTKSLKDRDYCVSGIDLKTGEWIRLVTSDKGGAFPKEMLDDNNIKELDVIEVNVKRYVPYHVQKENWLIDDKFEIQKLGTLTARQLDYIHKVENSETIFDSENNELTKDEIKKLKRSLTLLRVNNLVFDTSLKGDGRHHYKVNFEYNGKKYNLALTDPKYRNEDFDRIKIPTALIVVSLPAVPYGENEVYYKFVAKVII